MIANGAQKRPHVRPGSLRIISSSHSGPKTIGPVKPSGGFPSWPSIQMPPPGIDLLVCADSVDVVIAVLYAARVLFGTIETEQSVCRTSLQSWRGCRERPQEGQPLL